MILISNILSKIFLVPLLFLILFLAPLQHVEAQTGASAVTVIGGTGDFASNATALASRESAFKESFLDGVAWAAINFFIDQLTKEVVEWIQSDFEGKPQFALDLQDIITKAVDQEFLSLFPADIQENARFACSPFGIDIKLKLQAMFYQRGFEEDQCTISDIAKNIYEAKNKLTDEINGRSGWSNWFKIAATPHGNPYGDIVEYQQELNIRIRNKEGEEFKLIEFGNGFMSQRDCEDIVITSPENPGHKTTKEVCTVVTPGKVIENKLNTALDQPEGRLQVADEINEVLSTLMGQVFTKMFGSGGLLGGKLPNARQEDPSSPDALNELDRLLAQTNVEDYSSGAVEQTSICTNPDKPIPYQDENGSIRCYKEAIPGSCINQNEEWVPIQDGTLLCLPKSEPACGLDALGNPTILVYANSNKQVYQCVPDTGGFCGTNNTGIQVGSSCLELADVNECTGDFVELSTDSTAANAWYCSLGEPLCSEGTVGIDFEETLNEDGQQHGMCIDADQDFDCTDADSAFVVDPNDSDIIACRPLTEIRQNGICPAERPALAFDAGTNAYRCVEYIYEVSVCGIDSRMVHSGNDVYECRDVKRDSGSTMASCPAGKTLLPIGGWKYQCLSIPLEEVPICGGEPGQKMFENSIKDFAPYVCSDGYASVEESSCSTIMHPYVEELNDEHGWLVPIRNDGDEGDIFMCATPSDIRNDTTDFKVTCSGDTQATVVGGASYTERVLSPRGDYEHKIMECVDDITKLGFESGEWACPNYYSMDLNNQSHKEEGVEGFPYVAPINGKIPYGTFKATGRYHMYFCSALHEKDQGKNDKLKGYGTSLNQVSGINKYSSCPTGYALYLPEGMNHTYVCEELQVVQQEVDQARIYSENMSQSDRNIFHNPHYGFLYYSYGSPAQEISEGTAIYGIREWVDAPGYAASPFDQQYDLFSPSTPWRRIAADGTKNGNFYIANWCGEPQEREAGGVPQKGWLDIENSILGYYDAGRRHENVVPNCDSSFSEGMNNFDSIPF